MGEAVVMPQAAAVVVEEAGQDYRVQAVDKDFPAVRGDTGEGAAGKSPKDGSYLNWRCFLAVEHGVIPGIDSTLRLFLLEHVGEVS